MPCFCTTLFNKVWIWALSTPLPRCCIPILPADVLERIEDVVLNRRSDGAERLIELAETMKNQESSSEPSAQQIAQQAWRTASVQERLKTRVGERHWRLPRRGSGRGSSVV